MNRIGREVGFAVAAWMIPFVASVVLFPLKSSHPPLFDTLMGVVFSTSTVVLGCTYLRSIRANHVARGTRIGAVWMSANWLLDGLMFSSGPMQMSLGQYVMDIGLAYLALPAITIGLGYAATNAHRSGSTSSIPPH